MTREEIEKRIKDWQFYGEEPDLMTIKLVNDINWAYLRLHRDHQQTSQDLRDLYLLSSGGTPTGLEAFRERLKQKYGWEGEP